MSNEIKIIFEGKDFLVIDKPAGITVNRSDTTGDEQTVQDWIDEGKLIEKGDDQGFLDRSGIVHRLDKETSGVLVIAKNKESFYDLQGQFKERGVKKTYIALVHGEVVPKKGRIDVPVGRLSWNRKRFGVVAGGREAQTEYEVIFTKESKNGGKLSLVRLNPKTGRTHQIRVHLKHLGYPIFGDPLYGGRKTSRNDRKVLPRVFLHASEITFKDPSSHEEKHFESPLPKELEEALGLIFETASE